MAENSKAKRPGLVVSDEIRRVYGERGLWPSQVEVDGTEWIARLVGSETLLVVGTVVDGVATVVEEVGE